MKKLLLIMAFAVFLTVPLCNAASFPDIEDSPYLDSILMMQKYGVLTGYPDGTFKPENNITRAEFVKILFEAKGFDKNAVKAVSLPFSDVQADAWYVPYVREAYRTKTVEGYPDGTFRPGDNIKISEAFKIVMSAFFDVDELYGDGKSYSTCSVDLSGSPGMQVNAWYWKYFYVADGKCLVPKPMEERMPDGFFDPAVLLQRGEMTEIVAKSKVETGIINIYPVGMLEYFSEYFKTQLNGNVKFSESYQYYNVAGTTKTKLKDSIDKVKATVFLTGTTIAHTDWLTNLKYGHKLEGKRCRPINPDVSLDIKFLYPNWISINEADDGLKQEWEDYLYCISDHENTHKEHGVAATNEVYDLLLTTYSDVSCDDLDSKVITMSDAIYAKYNAVDTKLDQDIKNKLVETCIGI